MFWINVGLSLLGTPALAAALYLAILAALARRPAALPASIPRLKFDVVVPAHDEEADIADTVRSVLAV
jgi:1,2-diacylglycerol 3-beta-glucosyltransferase